MSQSECPHCGELIDDDAIFCRHCGSDAETGWNPDADLLSLELPEEDDEPAEPPPLTRAEKLRRAGTILGPALVAGAWVFYVLLGAGAMRSSLIILLPATVLLLSILLLARLARRADR